MITPVNGAAGLFQAEIPKGEKSRLLAFNRKLRHLRGISLRNLALSFSPSKVRGKTFDDEVLPHTLKSPAKLLAVNESSSIAHSRSFSDLAAIGKPEAIPDSPETPTDGTRRSFNRRSSRPPPTLQRQNTSPRQRQDILKAKVSRRTADVFFSIHCSAVNEPVYISEVIENCMNPDFRAFDLSTFGTTITRQDELIVKFWAKARSSSQWLLLIELSLSLRYLQYIGKSLEGFHHPLPDNCVLFHLTDGIYTSFTDMPVQENGVPKLIPHPEKITINVEPSSSYDTLMRLSTLDECIQDAITTQQKLTAQISALISEDKVRYHSESDIMGARDSLASVKHAVLSERKQVRLAMAKVNELKRSIHDRKSAVHGERQVEERTKAHLNNNNEKLEKSQRIQTCTAEEIAGQRRRICEDLLKIYPIHPIPHRSLAFTIHNLPLPNSNFQDIKEDVTSAALGYVAHMVYLLSFYLSIPLPYSILPSSSTSLINDPISLMAGSRTFPLYVRGSVFYRFEYGVFLLNKDIELLASRLGLQILDIRQTLPNLKYILFAATAGHGEMPLRKSGGVRGLILREKDIPDDSRRTSIDSNDVGGLGTLKSIAALRASG